MFFAAQNKRLHLLLSLFLAWNCVDPAFAGTENARICNYDLHGGKAIVTESTNSKRNALLHLEIKAEKEDPFESISFEIQTNNEKLWSTLRLPVQITMRLAGESVTIKAGELSWSHSENSGEFGILNTIMDQPFRFKKIQSRIFSELTRYFEPTVLTGQLRLVSALSDARTDALEQDQSHINDRAFQKAFYQNLGCENRQNHCKEIYESLNSEEQERHIHEAIRQIPYYQFAAKLGYTHIAYAQFSYDDLGPEVDILQLTRE